MTSAGQCMERLAPPKQHANWRKLESMPTHFPKAVPEIISLNRLAINRLQKT